MSNDTLNSINSTYGGSTSSSVPSGVCGPHGHVLQVAAFGLWAIMSFVWYLMDFVAAQYDWGKSTLWKSWMLFYACVSLVVTFVLGGFALACNEQSAGDWVGFVFKVGCEPVKVAKATLAIWPGIWPRRSSPSSETESVSTDESTSSGYQLAVHQSTTVTARRSSGIPREVV